MPSKFNAVLQQELEKEKKRVDFCLDCFKLRGRQQDSFLYWFHHLWNADGMLHFFAALCKDHTNLEREENISW